MPERNNQTWIFLEEYENKIIEIIKHIKKQRENNISFDDIETKFPGSQNICFTMVIRKLLEVREIADELVYCLTPEGNTFYYPN